MNESTQRTIGDRIQSVLFDIWFLLTLSIMVLVQSISLVIRLLWKAILFPYLYIKKRRENLDYIYPPSMDDKSGAGLLAKPAAFLRDRFPKTSERLDAFFFGDGDRAQNNRVFFYFLAPAFFSFVLMVIFPFLTGIYYSLTDFRGIGTPNFIRLANYENIFNDMNFYYSFYRTSIYSILNIIVINVVAFSLALLVTQKLRLKNLYRAGFFMPNLIGGLVLGYIFQFVYSQVFMAIGASNVVTFISDLINVPILQKNLYTSGASNSMIAIIIVVTWQYAGYIMMIYIAAIQNIPQSLVEASKIDGANAWQRLRNITLPLVAQAFTVAMFLTLVTSFKQFDTVFAMTGGGPTDIVPGWLANLVGGNPLTGVPTLDLMAVNIYDTAFADQQFGLGQAKAIIFFAILLVISLAQVYFNKKREVEF
jgi:raffinose/stachyose/melibiose transport system permease protein